MKTFSVEIEARANMRLKCFLKAEKVEDITIASIQAALTTPDSSIKFVKFEDEEIDEIVLVTDMDSDPIEEEED